MEAHCKPYTLWVLTLTLDTCLPALANTHPLSILSLETDPYRSVRSGRKWVEYVWTLKPALIIHLLETYSLPALTYIDGDSAFFGSPAPLFTEIADAPLAITPHRLHPDYAFYIVNGEFNGGFIHAKPAGLPCLHKWAEQCLDWCFLAYDTDRFVDQKYLNSWPRKWGAHAIQQKGVNLAPWNQRQYAYTLRDGNIFVDDDPLVWYHFHQGLATGYPLHPFVKQHIYAPYKEMVC